MLADRRGRRLAGHRSTAPPCTSRRYDGWAQAFGLPADGGRLRAAPTTPGLRLLLLWVQLGLLVLVVVLALPRSAPRSTTRTANADVGADLPERRGGRRRGVPEAAS